MERGSIVVTVDASGAIRIQGRPVALEDVAGLRRPDPPTGITSRDFDPILLELDPSITFNRLRPVLEAIIVTAKKVNVSFLVSTSTGARTLTLPILIAHGCHCLLFIDGRSTYDEHREGADSATHLWIRARVGGGGTIRVDRLDLGLIEDREPVFVPDGGVRPAPVPQDLDWRGPHPPLGEWAPETLRQFLAEPPIVALSPFCELDVRKGDTVGDVVQFLFALREAAGSRLVVSLKPGVD